MIPIQEFGLARVLFHEIGHHVRITKSHGVKKIYSENYADEYTRKRMNEFILKSVNEVENCFNKLEQIANKGKMSLDTIESMKKGWRNKVEEAKMVTYGV